MTTPAAATPAKLTHKQRFIHEMKQYAAISVYLAVLFCTVAAYTILLNRSNDIDSPLSFGFAILNALVLGKVILIGEMMHLGRRAESRPVYQSAAIKSVIFGLLIFAFHLVEEGIKRVIHHLPAGTVLHETNLEVFAARSLIVLVALFPLFVYRELARVLGESRLYTLLTKREETQS